LHVGASDRGSLVWWPDAGSNPFLLTRCDSICRALRSGWSRTGLT